MTEASDVTENANARLLHELPFDDRQDFDDAQRGFIATVDEFDDVLPNGLPVWNLSKFAFLDSSDAPGTVVEP
ncbi:hypothetical protein [Leifsonia sp. TF02-11]|uniref:hypothetical protein n=1 Tax=Leifsonia sp. TF02-11 TaxID=2815212 RepID=UPI001AA0EEB8|nr:hypothetical protein [Leifsonia sp. TF02-11]MBO1737997.1 hypothetical protein [Leifsonia sp. TF02-11]